MSVCLIQCTIYKKNIFNNLQNENKLSVTLFFISLHCFFYQDFLKANRDIDEQRVLRKEQNRIDDLAVLEFQKAKSELQRKRAEKEQERRERQSKEKETN